GPDAGQGCGRGPRLLIAWHFRLPRLGAERELAALPGEPAKDAAAGHNRASWRDHVRSSETGLSFRYGSKAIPQTAPRRAHRRFGNNPETRRGPALCRRSRASFRRARVGFSSTTEPILGQGCI